MTHNPSLNPVQNPSEEEERIFSWLQMASKGLKYAIKTGVVIGGLGSTHFVKMDHILDLVMASSVGMGLLTCAYNYLKFKVQGTKYEKLVP